MSLIAPSLLAANFLNLEAECKMLNESEADWFHLDVMDGRFVPNISYGLPVISQLRKATTKPFDVHLMIEEPGNYAEAFKNAGADHLTVGPRSQRPVGGHVDRALEAQARPHGGCRGGVAGVVRGGEI